MDAAPEHVNEYEAQRAARIAANRQRMEEMGVLQAAQQLKTLQQKPMRWRPPNQKKKAEPVDLVATRVSKRIRGQPIEATVQVSITSRPTATVEACCIRPWVAHYTCWLTHPTQGGYQHLDSL